jgi:voltage-gated potassium channel
MLQTKVKIGHIFVLIIIILAFGTILFNVLERWSMVDSFYFTATTLTTIGYGDLVPSTDFSKLATVFFSLSGVTVFLYALSLVTTHYIEKGQQFEEYEAQKIKEIIGNLALPFKKKKGLKK